MVLIEPEYRRVEDVYASAAVTFLREAEILALASAGLENHGSVTPPFAEGKSLGLMEIGEVLRQLLWEEF